jgi:hypothetical protein
MARFASVIEHSGNMIRICRSRVVCRMAWITVSVHQLVVVVDVALRTLHGDVRAHQSEFRRVMIKRCRSPCCCRVTLYARLRIPKCHMIWIRRICEIGSMTIHTVCREAGVLVVDMAVLALNRPMGARQSKLRRIMVKIRRSPDTRRMTGLALMAEARNYVYRACRPCIISLMALEAIGICQLIITVHVT